MDIAQSQILDHRWKILLLFLRNNSSQDFLYCKNFGVDGMRFSHGPWPPNKFGGSWFLIKWYSGKIASKPSTIFLLSNALQKTLWTCSCELLAL